MSEALKKKVELLAPAGSFEKLEVAIHYGADAVYLAGKEFSLRNFSGNFTLEELADAIAFAHARGVKVYVACNIFPRNHEQKALASYLEKLGELSPDGVIIADPGVLLEAAVRLPGVPLHLSTQTNTTNYRSVQFWEKAGVSRINLARELSLSEVEEIVRESTAEIEVFIHGAMCISYSGRCLLSSFMTGRDANRGRCTHPCRWKYAVMEETRPGQYFPVEEDETGTYIFSSRDLCMIGHLPALIGSGVASLKIEGRMKSIHYTASVVKVYREAIDRYYADPEGYRVEEAWLKELDAVSHRPYSTGFYFGAPASPLPPEGVLTAIPQRLIAKILSQGEAGTYLLDVRNKFFAEESVEVLTSRGPVRPDRILSLSDVAGGSLPLAQPNSRVRVALTGNYAPHDLIRRPE